MTRRAVPPPANLNFPEGNWPSDFAPPRNALLALFCVAAWGGILAIFAAGNDLLGLKKALLILAGARMEPVLGVASLHSVDIAIVIAGFIAIAGAGYVHVSLGLAVVLALRPWLDGFTYPTDNFYFLWAVLYLVALWALRQLRAPRPLRGHLPMLMLLGFLACGVLSTTGSIELDTTFRELLHWVAGIAAFFLALNATPHPTSIVIVLLGLFAGMAGQALFAYPHLWYVLPWIREYLQADPSRLAQWFKGATEFTPELARRFNLNRAFASMVFPNALAALLILGIPASLSCAWTGGTVLRRPAPTAAPPITAWRHIVPWGLALFVAVCAPIYLLGQLPLIYSLGKPLWLGGAFPLIYLSVSTAALVATFFLLGARRAGLSRAGRVLGAIAALMLFPVMCGALWLTYSRGAMLALFAATCVCLVVHFGPEIMARRLRKVGTALVLALLLCGVALSARHAASAEGPANPHSTTVSGEGMDVTVWELSDPSSFRLRLSYWRVALSIALDHSGTGVGLGNFRIAYGPYQYLGAGDVQNAHNAVLQTWCETGLPGLIAFLGFWGVFLWQGQRAIRAEQDPSRRFLALGLYGGVLAFLCHAMLDINFSHPTLVMYVLACAGLCWRLLSPERVLPAGRGRALALSVLLFAALAGGAALRPFLLDLAMSGGRFINVSNRSMNDARQDATLFFLVDGPAWAAQGKPSPAPSLPIDETISLISDRTRLFEVGKILAPDPEGKRMLPLAPESALPADAVFQVVRPWAARDYGLEGVETWLAELERLDLHYPWNPQTAYLLASLYKTLVEQSGPETASERTRWLAAMQHWAEISVRRSPMHKDMYQMLAWTEWCYGSHTQGAESLAHFERALRNFRRSTELGHLEPNYYFAESQALAAMGKAFQKAGKSTEGAAYLAKSEALRSEGEQLQRARWNLGLQ